MSTDDILALNRLAYRYAAAVDACDRQAFLAVFTADGRLRTWQPDADEPFVDLRGHDQLAFVPKVMNDLYRRTAHLMTNHMVEIDGDRASARTMLINPMQLGRPQSDHLFLVGCTYVDELVRTADGWRIAKRVEEDFWAKDIPADLIPEPAP